jgi:hypothetical protein
MKNDCKRVFGVMVCKFKNGLVATFPASDQVDVNVFTEKDCPECKKTLKEVKKFLKPLKDVVNIKKISLEKNGDQYPDINNAPTVQIGNETFNGLPNKSLIWSSLFSSMGTSGRASDWEM